MRFISVIDPRRMSSIAGIYRIYLLFQQVSTVKGKDIKANRNDHTLSLPNKILMVCCD